VAQAQAHVTTQLALVRKLSAASQRADAAYHGQVAAESRARADSASARTEALRAQAIYNVARRNLITVLAAQYESGGSAAYSGELLAADSPSDLVDAMAMQGQLSRYQSVVEARAQAAHEVAARADAARRSALSAAVARTAAVRRAQNKAARLYADARQALVTLRGQLLEARATQQQAEAVLSSFVGGWSLADPQRASELDQSYATLADRARNTPMAPAGTRWSAAMGQSVVNRALQTLGTPYAWDGGSAGGPTTGVCAAGAAGNDCHIVGFDCSGLSLYSWSPYVALPHNAASQYSAAGSVHPQLGALLPGDLVFWSSNGSAGGIHHVAIYVGNGNVIQAPESGDVVRITPLGSVSAGYFGATRPLS
jgi:cell wall-associated NlpC family hydrolase